MSGRHLLTAELARLRELGHVEVADRIITALRDQDALDRAALDELVRGIANVNDQLTALMVSARKIIESFAECDARQRGNHLRLVPDLKPPEGG